MDLIRLASLVAACSALAACGAGVAAADPPFSNETNLIQNATGQDGLSGWEANDFSVAPTGQPNTPGTDVAPDVFLAAFGGATMSQTVDLGGLATAIDTGDQRLQLYGFFGGSGAGPDDVGMTVQLLDGNGNAVGAPLQLGPPTAADRLDSTLVVPCQDSMMLPAGVRAARVTLTAEGDSLQPSTALAYDPQLYVEYGIAEAAIRLHANRASDVNGLFRTDSLFFPAYDGGTVEYSLNGPGSSCGVATFVPAGQQDPGIVPATPAPAVTTPSQVGTAPAATTPVPGTTTPTTPRPAPESPVRSRPRPVAAPALHAVRIDRARLAFRISRAAKVRMTLRSTAHRAHTARPRPIRLTLDARSGGDVVHSFHPVLTRGRYALRLRVLGASGAAAVSRIVLIG